MFMNIKPITQEDRNWVKQVLLNLWGSEEMVTRGKLINITNLPGFIAEEDGRRVGLVTYQIENNECEIASLNALTPGRGIGTALIGEVEKLAKEKYCNRLLVITTNDNTNALHFYQKREFVIANVKINIMPEYRKLKRQIPETGTDDIPLRDEIELEKTL